MNLADKLRNFVFFGGQRIKGGNFLVLDIGTEFIKVLIFSVPDDKEGKIIVRAVARERQREGDMQAGAVVNLEGVIATCRQAIQKVRKDSGIEAGKAIVGIAGEFVWGRTTKVCCVREEPSKEIDITELKNLVQKLQWKAFEKIRKQSTEETGVPELEIKLIAAAIVETLIDGYRVVNPLGFCGKELCLGLFNAYAPLVHLGALQSIVDNLNLELLCVAVEPYAITEAVGFNRNEGAVIIDVGGGTTDIALVRRGVLEGTKSFALGGRAFTRRLAQKLGIDFNEAEEIKIKYTQKKLSMSVTRKLTHLFRRDINVWLNGVEYCLKDFSQTQLLPRQFLLCGGGSLILGMKRALEGTDWIKNLPFSGPPQVHYLEMGDISGLEDATKKLASPQDITPASLAFLASALNINKKEILREIINQAVKVIQK